ncbi:MAG TPA: PQQ-binding-like beta-propeller repeat protein [Planctomycetota bacterium]|nr:PQQ-binding-like beta-propeller repeat protein [Planctomycetota bacterium]
MNAFRRATRLGLLAALLLAAEARAQEWTRFRGPNGIGVSESKGIPTTWTEKDFRWRVTIPGESHSNPVFWGDKIFLESSLPDARERLLLCLRKEDGSELWSRKVALSKNPKHNLNSFASSTPAVDKDRVYALFADVEKYLVKAWDHAGKELWTVNLGPFKSQHGLGTSPVVYDEHLIVANDQDGDSFIVALDVKTGKIAWKCPRRGVEQNTAYGTPAILERKGEPAQILTTSFAYGISGLDARTGAILWEAHVFDKRSVSSPVVVGDLVFGSCGSGGGGNFVAAVKLGGKGDVTSSHLAYTVKGSAPYVPTMVSSGERLFWIADDAVATCIDPPTGRVIWKERVADKVAFYGSPVLIDGKIYQCSARGEMIVLAASDEFKILARNPMGEGSHSTPCVDGDRLYLKTFTHLVCLGAK